jgi:hypothetical protein
MALQEQLNFYPKTTDSARRRARSLGRLRLLGPEAKALRDAASVIRIGLGEVVDPQPGPAPTSSASSWMTCQANSTSSRLVDVCPTWNRMTKHPSCCVCVR